MSILDGFDNVPELHHVEPGEYEVVITRAANKLSKNGQVYTLINFDFCDDNLAFPMSHNLWHIDKDAEPIKQHWSKQAIVRFMECFSISAKDFEPNDAEEYPEIVGKTGWVTVDYREQETDGVEYKNNIIKSFSTKQ